MDRGSWWAIVQRATKSWTWLSDLAHTEKKPKDTICHRSVGGRAQNQACLLCLSCWKRQSHALCLLTPAHLQKGRPWTWNNFVFLPMFLATPELYENLVPWLGIEPAPPAVVAHNLNYWTTREVFETLSYLEIKSPRSLCWTCHAV